MTVKNNPKTKIENIVVQDFENEVLIYDLTINKVFCLNQTSAMIWHLCDGKYSVEQMSRILSQKMNQPITDDLIWLALDQFKRDGLLEDEQFEINFNGLSRRQIIKKIGFASTVVLPLISSVVAPTSAMAQSGVIPLFGACPTGGGCAPNLACVTCSRGNGCSGGTICCVNAVSPGSVSGPGYLFCTGVPNCNGAETFCCSGSATFVPSSLCVMNGLAGGCVCD